MTGARRSTPSLTIFTGTKAQLLKLAPLAIELERRGWPFRIIDTGQHARLIGPIVDELGLPAPAHSLDPGQTGVDTLAGGLIWLLRLARRLVESRTALARELFDGQNGLCVVHGDTVSTLLATLIARRAGQRVAHVEAGLRSHDFLNPFPEELVRVIVMRLADVLFAPSPAAFENLRAMGLGQSSHLLPANTNLDVVRLSLSRATDAPMLASPGRPLPRPFALATIHRLETLYRPRRLRSVVDFLLQAQERTPLVLIEHPPTARRLRSTGLADALDRAGVRRVPLVPHTTFVRLLAEARFVLTDGGSVQEEASYLGTPCLLLRRTTERDEGLGANVVLSKLRPSAVIAFLDDVDAHRGPDRTRGEGALESPSAVVADHLGTLLGFDGFTPHSFFQQRDPSG